MRKELFLSETDSRWLGVCGGLAEYFDIDSTVVRILFVVFGIFGSIMVLAVYFIIWILLKDKRKV